MRLRRRSSVSGKFVSKRQAKLNPATTVTETVPEQPAAIGYAEALCLALSVEGDLDRISPQSVAAYYALMEHLPR